MCDPNQLTITISGGTTTEPWHKKHDPEHTQANLPYKATVTDQNGQPKANVSVTITTDVTSDSGGHVHTSGRPKGKLVAGAGASTKAGKETITGTTNGSGIFEFTFGAEEASGTHTITATCDLCVNKTETAKVEVMVPGLTTLTASPDYILVGGETGKKHTDNHYLSAAAKENLLAIVEKYNKKYPAGPLLRLNDASLIWGGEFDIAGNWAGDHKEHRRGDVIDIRANQDFTAIPEANFKDFQTFASQSGGAFASLHCNPPYSRTCPGCILDTGTNRHFHVYLLGK